MSLAKWKKISQNVLFRNAWWTYKKDETELPNGKKGEYHYVHTNGASMVIPVLDSGEIIMIRQYRYLNDRESLEFPCGGVKDGESHEETAKHELQEEAGYESGEMHPVGEFNPYNGVTDEICRVYIARDLIEVESKPDETEEFEEVILNMNELDDRIRKGIIWDGMTLAAWIIAKPHIFL
jgi:ADP-ribose pyrophosphatase